eukprot:790430-Rhodomonas_salina.2
MGPGTGCLLGAHARQELVSGQHTPAGLWDSGWNLCDHDAGAHRAEQHDDTGIAVWRWRALPVMENSVFPTKVSTVCSTPTVPRSCPPRRRSSTSSSDSTAL